LKRADHFAFFDKDMEIFNALCYQLIAGKLKLSDVKTLREKRVVGILPAFYIRDYSTHIYVESISIQYFYRLQIFLLTQEEEVNLGTKDSKAKEYLSDNTRFSEICNYVLFVEKCEVVCPLQSDTHRKNMLWCRIYRNIML